MKKTYFELNLKNFDRAQYCYDSERNNVGSSFEWGEILWDKKFKYNFIEIYGKGLKFSPILKQISLFKNKNKKNNPFILKNKKPLTFNHKIGSLIDVWELVIWCSEDFKKINKNNDKGKIKLYYFTDEPGEYYHNELDKEFYDFWKDMSSDYEKSPRYFSSTSKINLAIMMDKTNFENIKKGILNGRKPKKNTNISGNPFNNKLLNFSKIKFEFDPDSNWISKISSSNKIPIGNIFDVNSLFYR